MYEYKNIFNVSPVGGNDSKKRHAAFEKNVF